MNHLVDIDITDKKVGLRVDLNVPIENGEILNHERLSAALPSILYILERTKKLCIISHLGRPEEGSFNENYSLEPIKNWFQKRLNVEIPLLSEFKNIPESLCLMENIRFFKGEKDNASELSAMISNCFDVYVMDAFATAHRQSASTYGAILEAKEACAGQLFSQEIKSLDSALHNSENVLSIVGGSKVSTKLNVIKNLISNSSKVLVGGGIANTFLKAAGYEVGISLVEDEMIDISRKLLDTNKIILWVTHNLDELNNFSNKFILLQDAPLFKGEYTPIGEVVYGFEILDTIADDHRREYVLRPDFINSFKLLTD